MLFKRLTPRKYFMRSFFNLTNCSETVAIVDHRKPFTFQEIQNESLKTARAIQDEIKVIIF